ncbi:MAG: hypothetical protein ACO3UU_08200 [Minisyncoccia bacterium]
MVKSKRKRTSKRFLYFFLNNKIHKVLRSNRSKDEIIAWSYSDKKRMLYPYSQVKKYMEKAYSTAEVAKILGRHKVTIEDYILDGKIKMPQRIYPISNPESSWSKFMFSESDILEIHQFILDSGYSKDLPSRNELRALLKNNMILYTKTDEGSFVPIWKAE